MRWFPLFKILLAGGVILSVCGGAHAGAEIPLGKIIFKMVKRGSAMLGEFAAVPAARQGARMFIGGTLGVSFVAIGYGDVTIGTANASSPTIDISRHNAQFPTKANRCVLSYGTDGKCWPCVEEHGSPSCKIVEDEDAISISCNGAPCKAMAIMKATADHEPIDVNLSRPDLKAALAEAANGTSAAGDTKAGFPVVVLCFSKDGVPPHSALKTVAERLEKTLKASGARTDLVYADLKSLGSGQISPGVLRILYSDQDEEQHYKMVREALENKFGFLMIESRKKAQNVKGLQVLLAL
jgi:hypothetical protein